MKYILTCLFLTLIPSILIAQSEPVLIIDGTTTTFKSGLSFPYWLKAGQTINLGSNVKSISVLEFTIDSSNLKFSQVLSITNLQTIPAGKTWKMESLGFGSDGQSFNAFSNETLPTIFISPKTFSLAGTFDWIVPPGVTYICIEAWGAGGSGQYPYGGGGGAYGYQCFNVNPGTHYTVIVGQSFTNSNGGNSSFGNLIIANGGIASNNSTSTFGIGGTSNATFNISGSNAINSSGAFGGNSYQYGPGFGGQGGEGASGQIKIYW